jgi:hypothetical protein
VAQFDRARASGLFASFGRVLIQDSTTLPLHPRLASVFPGSRNQFDKVHAIAKIQAVYDLLREQFLSFSLSGFTRNDQAASTDILNVARGGDLVLRDLGYFVLPVFAQLHQRGAFFLSRLPSHLTLWDDEGHRFDLLKQLRRWGRLDVTLRLGQTHAVPVRLVAVPLPQAHADARRRTARQNRDGRCPPGKTRLALLGWEIFITNVPAAVWTTESLAQVYGLRWRIEIVFKSWKSNFRMAHLPNVSAHQIQAMIYARLLFICLFQSFFNPLAHYIRRVYKRSLSLLRLSQFLAEHHWLIAPLIQTASGLQHLENLIVRHCCYRKRTDQVNYAEDLQCLS